MTSLKARDLKGIKDEMLKWKGKEAHAWVGDVLMMHWNMACLMTRVQIGLNLYIYVEMLIMYKQLLHTDG